LTREVEQFASELRDLAPFVGNTELARKILEELIAATIDHPNTTWFPLFKSLLVALDRLDLELPVAAPITYRQAVGRMLPGRIRNPIFGPEKETAWPQADYALASRGVQVTLDATEAARKAIRKALGLDAET
jgi:hypothetical protein